MPDRGHRVLSSDSNRGISPLLNLAGLKPSEADRQSISSGVSEDASFYSYVTHETWRVGARLSLRRRHIHLLIGLACVS